MTMRRYPRRPMSLSARYTVRFVAGLVLYSVALAIALVMRGAGIGTWQPMLLTLPSVAVMAWAIVAYYRESDEFAQRKLAESFIIAFAVGVPALLVIGLLESFGGPHLNWMIAFAIMMAGWLIGSLVANARYR